MNTPAESLNHLNSQQHQAVTAGGGQVLVLAGPGSGKTRVLTERIAYLVRARGVPPYRILAVTFTNKAAREMQSRLQRLLGSDCEDLWLGTFHATCARILRREAVHLPFNASFTIMDSDDQEALVKRSLKELGLDEKLYRPGALHASISNAKNSLLQAANYPVRNYRDEVVKRVFERYQQLLQQNNAVDFDDLLQLAVRLLEVNPAVGEKYARRFEHVLVDEFQDTNQAQYQLLGLLTGFHRNLFVVGDEDQSIYRWRGADYRNILRFEEDYPQSSKILLEQNYRSTQTVLDAARSVINRNLHRTPKHLYSERGRGDPIILYEAIDDHAEAAYVVDNIRQMMRGKRQSGGEFAVMYRTNAQSRLLEEAFLRAGLPYRLVGAQRFYGRREVKDIIAFLRLVANPDDEISLLRCINVPPRGIGSKTLVALQLTARQAERTPGEVVLDLGQRGGQSPYWASFAGRGASVLADFGSLLAGWRNDAESLALPGLFDRILSDTVYQEYLQDGTEEGSDRWANVQELRKLAYEYAPAGLIAFLESLALVSDQDTLPEQADAPTLLTLHAAKGLEFPQVFIVGLDEGLLPHSRSRDDPEEMAEERRLFYVGLTRAKNRLYLVRAAQRTSFGSVEYSEPSRFVDDIPPELLKREGVQVYSPRQAADWQSTRWQGTTLAPTAAPPTARAGAGEVRFRPAMRVHHPAWGEGMVLDSRWQDEDETVDVIFESVGFKRLVASMARLEILDGSG